MLDFISIFSYVYEMDLYLQDEFLLSKGLNISVNKSFFIILRLDGEILCSIHHKGFCKVGLCGHSYYDIGLNVKKYLDKGCGTEA